ncbi:MAG: bifunctional phosphopantothenoylcysteine decarboxylase/phosphopantothenate--cysteine ligase CoaBC [Deltaproteobacteria bacterium]|jgi:phosphopantothenoylcysteine decarboxylase/phosphopantothenate--cysteine ligase|nr:bifunctional phosphopantothenoylcysteine decarboxylase/phosphopantothenate--cysteine ligase CoaBC [Deltaproteobacteria bacterium]
MDIGQDNPESGTINGPGLSDPLEGPLSLLKGKKIILTVTGGVAAYKAAALARLMAKAGALVRVVMTEAGERFVGTATFSALTGQPVATDMWARPGSDGSAAHNVQHVAWAEWADLIVTAPASADYLAKLAHGLAGDLATTIALAFMGPSLVAPAMNTGMFLNPATSANLDTLRARGYAILGSPEGLLACGSVGPGRMAEPEVIAQGAARILSGQALKGKNVLVTGGATQERWDDIRYITNRSSGRMGLALAEAAWLMGAQVTYLAGPAAAVPAFELPDFMVTRAESTADLLAEVKGHLPGSWALMMNAAPADFTPAVKVSGKIKKTEGEIPPLVLARTPDILTEVGPLKGNCLMVGFAAEEKDLLVRAKEKLARKNLDYIAANQAGGPKSAFGSNTIKLSLISAKLNHKQIGPVPKFQAAWTLWQTLIDGWS